MSKNDRFKDGISEAQIGEVTATYDTLVRAFGEPEVPKESQKTRVEWIIQSPFGRLVIGDWDQHDTRVADLTLWFVNGQFRRARDAEEANALGEVALVKDVPAALAWLKDRLMTEG